MSITGLLVGLGNPGPNYENTRHNFGFLMLDAVLGACRNAPGGDAQPLSGGKGRYDAWKCRLPSSDAWWILAKPQTFMNKSGDAVAHLLGYYRIPLDALWVAHDELDLPLGRMRLKFGGGAAGHNGIRSIAERTGSPDFHRLRLGIGKPQGYDATSFVLGRFSAQETSLVREVCEEAAAAFCQTPRLHLERVRQRINGFAPTQADNPSPAPQIPPCKL